MPGIPDRQVFMCIDVSVCACSKWMYEGFFFCCGFSAVAFSKSVFQNCVLARGRILISSNGILFICESCSLLEITVHFVKHT
jgi:hypothetical protein